MTTTTNGRFGSRFGARLASAAVSLIAVVIGLPAVLIAVATKRFHHASPLHGVKVPWRWSVDDLQSWARRLTEGLDSSAALVDLFFHLALVVGWICAAVLIYTMSDEFVFQVRHGMPSAGRHRRLGGLGLLGRKLATVFMAVLPLAISASPALTRSVTARAAVGVVGPRVDDLGGPDTTVLAVPVSDASSVASPLGPDWSTVEVRRGDSVWAIAARVAGDRDIAAIADQIVAANLGTVMNDGDRFSTPALIEPGWLLNVPVAVTPGAIVPVTQIEVSSASAGDSHVVVTGDSYWGIAEDHLGPNADAGEVAAFTQELMRINAPVLDYSDRRLIRPGDVVQLGVAEAGDPAPPPAVVEPAEVPIRATDPLQPVAVDTPPSVVAPHTSAPVPTVEAFPPPVAATRGSSVPVPMNSRITDVVDRWSGNGIPVKRGLGAAVLLSGGAVLALDARRRQQLRGSHVGARLLAPTARAMETETLLRALTPGDRLARIDLALRCAAPDLARQHARALAVEIADDGELRVFTDRPALISTDRWVLDVEAGAWRLPGNVSLADLAAGARRGNQPCPAIIHIGESAGGHLFVDLEAVGVLSVDTDPVVAASIVRCAAASLAVSPFAESTRVFTVGLEIETHLGNPSVESHESLAEAIEAVRVTVGSITTATSGTTTTFALRATARGGEAWEPALLLAIGVDDPQVLAVVQSVVGGGGRGVGVMIDRPIAGSGAVLRATDGEFILEPFGWRVTPVGLSGSDVEAVDNLLDASERPLLTDCDLMISAGPVDIAERRHRAPALVVQVLGNVAVQAANGDLVGFDRSKSLELVVWLSQHRHRPTRSSARTALWDIAVRDATFSNVVSDARRAMAKLVTPPAGQEWLGRTMNEDLPMHELVVSDVELLAERVEAARGLDAQAAIPVLRPGIELIHGMPFAGTSYMWPDAEGITSTLVLLATSAAADLAGHYLSVGDIDGVFWSTGQGLKVLAGHEELIALRMRAHAHRGDLAGVRGEWDSYERAIHADTWAAEPSPKLIELRRELLPPSLAS